MLGALRPLAIKLKDFRNHGMTRVAAQFGNTGMAFADDGSTNPWYYEMPAMGFNYRASAIHCALGLSQLARLDHFVERRRQLVAQYDELLAPLTPLVRPLVRMAGCSPAWHLYVALIDFDAADTNRAKVMNALRKSGIGSQVHYIPVHSQPYYRDLYGKSDLLGAETYYARCLSLPLFFGLNDIDIRRVCEALSKAISK
jgi:dTDP-4-amino-4,6-dideoxygalactose transaminase